MLPEPTHQINRIHELLRLLNFQATLPSSFSCVQESDEAWLSPSELDKVPRVAQCICYKAGIWSVIP